MTKELYCVEHERMEEVEPWIDGNEEVLGHWFCSYWGSYENPPEYDYCEFPLGWTIAPPPESLFEDILACDDDDVWERWCAENDPALQVDNLTRVFEFIP